MKNFTRAYPLFSLCGLNCLLCTMHLGGHCPGCGGGEGNQSCSIARCSIQKGVEFCPFCTAVNLLTLTSLRQIIEQCAGEITPEMRKKK